MPNVAKVLKDEIARISRKEAKAAVTPIRKPSARLRKDVADLKRRLALLEKVTQELAVIAIKMGERQPSESAEPPERARISGKGIKSLRKRLGLSQADLARLVGVSEQTVYVWEQKAGMLKPRGSTGAKLFAVRGIGAREAKARLEELKAAAGARKKRG